MYLLHLCPIGTEHYCHNFFGRWKKRHNLGTYFKALNTKMPDGTIWWKKCKIPPKCNMLPFRNKQLNLMNHFSFHLTQKESSSTLERPPTHSHIENQFMLFKRTMRFRGRTPSTCTILRNVSCFLKTGKYSDFARK